MHMPSGHGLSFSLTLDFLHVEPTGFDATRLEKRHACSAAELLNRRRKRYRVS